MADNDYSALIKQLKKKDPKELDRIFREMHDEEFEKIDCLQCANCCKTLGPRFTMHDIEKISTHLKLKTATFIDQYLRIDEDGDYVFKSMPCPFLMPDNYCLIYNQRTKACREYPHTNAKNIRSILKICELNTQTCPVVKNIFDRLKEELNG